VIGVICFFVRPTKFHYKLIIYNLEIALDISISYRHIIIYYNVKIMVYIHDRLKLLFMNYYDTLLRKCLSAGFGKYLPEE